MLKASTILVDGVCSNCVLRINVIGVGVFLVLVAVVTPEQLHPGFLLLPMSMKNFVRYLLKDQYVLQ